MHRSIFIPPDDRVAASAGIPPTCLLTRRKLDRWRTSPSVLSLRYLPQSGMELLRGGSGCVVRQVMGYGCSKRREPACRRRGMERMKAVLKMIASTALLFALASVALDSSAAMAAAAQQSESYCMGLGEGGTDCGFTSFAQCQASASGRNAVCFRSPSGNDEASSSAAGGSEATQVRHPKVSRGVRR